MNTLFENIMNLEAKKILFTNQARDIIKDKLEIKCAIKIRLFLCKLDVTATASVGRKLTENNT